METISEADGRREANLWADEAPRKGLFWGFLENHMKNQGVEIELFIDSAKERCLLRVHRKELI